MRAPGPNLAAKSASSDSSAIRCHRPPAPPGRHVAGAGSPGPRASAACASASEPSSLGECTYSSVTVPPRCLAALAAPTSAGLSCSRRSDRSHTTTFFDAAGAEPATSGDPPLVFLPTRRRAGRLDRLLWSTPPTLSSSRAVPESVVALTPTLAMGRRGRAPRPRPPCAVPGPGCASCGVGRGWQVGGGWVDPQRGTSCGEAGRWRAGQQATQVETSQRKLGELRPWPQEQPTGTRPETGHVRLFLV
eukprot:356995-Chlamydomonas_euryale.AAC.25